MSDYKNIPKPSPPPPIIKIPKYSIISCLKNIITWLTRKGKE